MEQFYLVRDSNFQKYNQWAFKQHADTGDEEPLTPINLPTHMLMMAITMCMQDTPRIETLTKSTDKDRKRGTNAEKAFHGVYQYNSEWQGRDLFQKYLWHLFLESWGIHKVIWDDTRVPSSMKSELQKLVEKELKSDPEVDGEGSPDAKEYGDCDDDTDLPIIIEVCNPINILPIPGGKRERWAGIIERRTLRLVEVEDYYGVTFDRPDPAKQYANKVTGLAFDDLIITVYEIWHYVGSSIWMTTVAQGVPRETFNRNRYRMELNGFVYLKQPKRMPEYKRLPYDIRFGYPTGSEDPERYGLSMLYNVIDAVAAAERVASLQEEIVHKHGDPKIIRTFDSGFGEPPDVTTEPGAIITVDAAKGQAVSYLNWPGMPADIDRLRTFWIDLAKEFGFDVNMEGTSGLDSIVKKSGILAKTLVPVRQAESGLAAVYSRVISLLVNIVGDSTISVAGKMSVNSRSKSFYLSVKGSEFKGMELCKVKIKSRFPYEELQNLAAAQGATTGDNPLMSVYRARSEYMNIDDPEEEQQQIDHEQIHNSITLREAALQGGAMFIQNSIEPPPSPEPPVQDPVMAGAAAPQGDPTLAAMANPTGVSDMMNPINASGNAAGGGVPNSSIQQVMDQRPPGRPS